LNILCLIVNLNLKVNPQNKKTIHKMYLQVYASSKKYTGVIKYIICSIIIHYYLLENNFKIKNEIGNL